MKAEASGLRLCENTSSSSFFRQCASRTLFLGIGFGKVCPRRVIVRCSCVSGDEREAPTILFQPLVDSSCQEYENAIMSALVALFSSFVRKGEVSNNVNGARRWSRIMSCSVCRPLRLRTMGRDTQAVNVSHMRVLSGCMKFDRQLNDRVDRKADIRPITWKVSEDRSAFLKGARINSMTSFSWRWSLHSV